MSAGFRWLSIVLLLLLVQLALPQSAQAHTRSESHTSWVIVGSVVRVDVTLPDVEAARLTPNDERPSDKTFIDYFAGRLRVTTGDVACPFATPPHMLAVGAGHRRAEYVFDCPSDKNLTLEFTGLFDKVPTHIDFAQIQLSNGDMVEQLFTKTTTAIDASASSGNEFKDAGVVQFIGMGIMHIFTGIDHMSFLLGLVLLARRLKDLLFVVTGFTIGHSLTLALAVTGILRPHGEYIDALVALTIALVGVESIIHTQTKASALAMLSGGILVAMGLLRLGGIGLLPSLLLFGAGLFVTCYLMISTALQDMGRIRLLVTLIFGLVHGFGFASDLLKDKLPATKLAEILFGFNIGVEIGQVCVVLGIVGLVALLRKLKLSLPRPITVDVTASCLVGLGVYWFISRSF